MLHLHLLGGLRIVRDDTPVTDFHSNKGPALLAYLAVTGRPHFRTALAGLLWGELPEEDARRNLRVVLTNLRQHVAPYLQITRETVAFDWTSPYWLDVEQFEGALQETGPQHVDRLRTAVALYGGDFLEGFYVREAPDFEEWMLAQRERLRQRVLHALHELAGYHLAHQEYAAGIDACTRLLALDPWREDAHQQLMLLLALSGQHSAALAQYDICRRVLDAELGVEPSAETCALYQRILAGDLADAQSRQHPRAERGTLSDQTAPGQALVSTLPVPPTPLVGRATELAQIAAHLVNPTYRLLTLLGPGGVGKTRLALEAAVQHAHVFEDGVCFVDLAPLRDPVLVSSTVVQRLGMRETRDQSALAMLTAFLRKRHLLLLLDNFEHLLPAAAVVSDLLAHCPHLKVLVTSRAALRLRGEQEFQVPPLPVPDPRRLLPHGSSLAVALARYAAVELFVQRARNVKPDFALTDENAPIVAEICARLDGLPLAIELAATRLKLFSPPALLTRLHPEGTRRLALLTGGRRDLPARQHTLRDTIAWSYDLLDADEQALFRRLAVFVGGCTLDAAEAVCHADGEWALAVVDGIASLVDKSLLRQVDDPDGARRFFMLETVHEYALEQLALSGETEAIRQHHAMYFLALAEAAAPQMRGPEQAVWLQRLEVEHDNLRTALGYLLEYGDAEGVIQMGWALWLFWSIRGHLSEGQRWMERALAHGETLSLRARVQATWVRAMMLFLHGAVDQAAPLLEGCAEEAGMLGDQEVLMQTLGLRGFVAVSRGDLSSAAALLSEALMLARSRGDCWGIGNTLNGLAHVALAQGDFDRAMEHLQEGEALLREAGDWFSLIANLNIQALVAQLRGDVVQIRRLLHESVRISQGLGDKWAVAYGLIGLAIAAAMQGEAGRAARLYGATEVLLRGTDLAFAFPATRVLYEQHLATIRTRLDADAFMMAWAEGRAMTLEQAIGYALAEDA